MFLIIRKKIRDKYKLGFTLMEIVVTSGIIVFLMTAVWSSGALRSSDFHAMINQEKLRLLLTRAKSMTINGVFVGNSCGYGVRIESDRAFIFLDGRNICDRRYNSGEEVFGSANIMILREGVRLVSNVGATTDIVFVPPYIYTIINNNQNITEAHISIHLASRRLRGVIINSQALINLTN